MSTEESSPYEIVAATPAHIRSVWEERWGSPIITPKRSYEVEDVEGLVLEGPDGTLLALATWRREGDEAELVSMDAMLPHGGFGSQVLTAAETQLGEAGVRKLTLVTTNDNVAALGFYLKRGYRLVRLHLDAMDAVRRAKPEVPRIGEEGIVLRDMWELEKALD